MSAQSTPHSGPSPVAISFEWIPLRSGLRLVFPQVSLQEGFSLGETGLPCLIRPIQPTEGPTRSWIASRWRQPCEVPVKPPGPGGTAPGRAYGQRFRHR
jgi:hypothetical protein